MDRDEELSFPPPPPAPSLPAPSSTPQTDGWMWNGIMNTNNRILWLSLVFFWYGFFIDFKPSEPFLVPYLIDVKGFSNDTIEQKIFPIWTYAYFVSVVICGLISEALQYKPILVLGSFARVATRLILIFGSSLAMMQATQFSFGFACGTEVLFYCYIYYLVPVEHYQKLTGITRSSVLIGHVGANLLGQLLVTHFHSPLVVLMWISFVSISMATLISFVFPATKLEIKHCNHTFTALKEAFFDIVSSRELLLWSVWYILVNVCNDMILNYATNLFYVVDPNVSYNGAVMAAVRLSGALCAILPGLSFIEGRLEPARKVLVAIFTLLAGLVVIASPISNIWIVYGLLVIYMGLNTFCTSIASAQIAKSMATRKFAMVFALITMVYLGIESLFQLALNAANLGSRGLFVAFGVGLILASLVFIVLALAFRTRKQPYTQIDSAQPSAIGSIN